MLLFTLRSFYIYLSWSYIISWSLLDFWLAYDCIGLDFGSKHFAYDSLALPLFFFFKCLLFVIVVQDIISAC
jgi:hypothetical protein